MVWQDSKSAGDIIDAIEYTNMADTVEWVSSNYYAHSGDANIHFPSSLMVEWFNSVYSPSGSTPYLDDFYSSSLGVGISSNLKKIDDWFNASSSKISAFMLSGDEYSTAYTERGSQIAGANLTWNGTQLDATASEGGGTSYWSSQTAVITDGIYYEYPVSIVESGTTYGDYRFQVSGHSFLSGNVQFIGQLSGLAIPIFDSGAASKHYVDIISGALDAKIDAAGGATTLDELTDTAITTPKSGQVLTYGSDMANTTWQNQLPPITFNVANVRLLSGQNLNITRFDAGNKNVYVWQATCCNSGGAMTGDLSVELLSGTTSVYSTSSAAIQQGYPLAKSAGGNTEIRIKYSSTSGYGAEEAQLQYCTAFMEISVY